MKTENTCVINTPTLTYQQHNTYVIKTLNQTHKFQTKLGVYMGWVKPTAKTQK